jgi:peptide chain release factor 3
VNALYEPVSVTTARWIHSEDKRALDDFSDYYRSDLAIDAEDCLAYLAPNPWKLESAIERFPKIVFSTTREIS